MKRSVLMPLMTILAVLVITLIVLKSRDEVPGSQLPNIVFILADDMGYGDIGALNPGSKIPTPHMDRVAREGMYFTDAHSYSAVCTPTRYGVLTGRYAYRTRLASGVLGGHDYPLIEPGRETVASLLGRAGYRSACVGKWHLGLDWAKKDPDKLLYEGPGFGKTLNTSNVDYTKPVGGGPTDCGFDYSYIFPASLDMAPYVFIENKLAVNTDLVHIEGVRKREGKVFWRHGDAERDFDFYDVLPRLTRAALGFIRDHTAESSEKPFFLYYPLTAPHIPHMPGPEYVGKSEAGRYGDFVVQVDNNIGQILDLLDSLKITGNTLIFVTSDNGCQWEKRYIEEFGHLANYHFRGMKSDAWEGGHRVPFLARWPAEIAAGTSSDRMVCLTDLLATCAELTGQELDWWAGEDSFSFLSALTVEKAAGGSSAGGSESGGANATWEKRTAMVNQAISTVRSIRKDNWKLILDMSSGGWSKKEITDGPPLQLYNLSEDIGEQNNLVNEYPEKVEELKALLNMYDKEGRSRFR